MKDYAIGIFVGQQPQLVCDMPEATITVLLDNSAALIPALPPGVTLPDICERLRIELTARRLGLSTKKG